jgi:hypothetical protein
MKAGEEKLANNILLLWGFPHGNCDLDFKMVDTGGENEREDHHKASLV